MKRGQAGQWAGAAALGTVLSACSATPDPRPPAGDLLSAPTQLHFGGQVVTLEAAPRLSGPVLRVAVRVNAGNTVAASPKMTVHDLFVLARAGVWNAPFRAASTCTRTCLAGQGVGRGEGINAGEVVQVVLRVRDAQGRSFWLRDARAKVTGK